uniref:Uncharacterized protein n=1 Tax=Panagrolaimus davidi TaxID=227884 RepID=A0A914P8Z7_9BILA
MSITTVKLNIELLPDVNSSKNEQPIKIVYESYFPLAFRVTLTNNNADKNDTCIGVVDAQFGIIAVYGETNGINIVPSWDSGMATTFTIDINFMNGSTKVYSTKIENLPFDTIKKTVFDITIDYGQIMVVTSSKYPYAKAFDPSFLPDFIGKKYLSLSFFQPLQRIPASSPTDVPPLNHDVNKCRFVLDYNVWRLGQPFPYGHN